MQRDVVSERFPLGSDMPAFKLPNVDGTMIGNDYFKSAKAGLVVFSCNHCPYVKGSEEALMKIVKKFEREGLKTVVISSNDAQKYPEDSFDKMKEKAKAMSLPYPYLYDESQSVAKAFDAACTPECYLFSTHGILMFHGAINNNPRDSKQATTDYLSPAISHVLAGKQPSPPFVHPVGCSIKWK